MDRGNTEPSGLEALGVEVLEGKLIFSKVIPLGFTKLYILICLFDLILYVPANDFSFVLGQVFLG